MSREKYSPMKGPQRTLAWSLGAMGVLAAFLSGLMVRRQVDGLPMAPNSSPVAMEGFLASSDKGIQISETEYFTQLSSILEDLYVDGVKDRLALANGAVRGMVTSLADPSSAYYSKEQMDAITQRMEGKYQGIGVELELEFDQAELKKVQQRSRDVDTLLLIPVLRVTAAAPGGPAEKAGLRAGDAVVEINGRPVISSEDVKALRTLQEKASKDPSLADDLNKAREEFRKKAEHNLPPGKAREKLTTGTAGSLQIKAVRSGQVMDFSMTKASVTVPPLMKKPDGSYQVRFVRGLVQAFLQEGLTSKPAVLDLRGGGQGDFGVLKSLLEETAPKGPYGALTTARSGVAKTLAVVKGLEKGPKYTLLVDKTTRGAAEVFALAMSSRGRASLQGSSMAGQTHWIELYATSKGEGYSLATGIFRPANAGGAKAQGAVTQRRPVSP